MSQACYPGIFESEVSHVRRNFDFGPGLHRPMSELVSLSASVPQIKNRHLFHDDSGMIFE